MKANATGFYVCLGWAQVLSLPFVTGAVVTHIAQSTIFFSCGAVLLGCFEELDWNARGNVKGRQEAFLRLFRVYTELESLVTSLSTTYGAFMALELTCMVLTCIINLYFGLYVLLGYDAGYHPSLPFFIVPVYSLWLYIGCDIGEKLHFQVRRNLV